MTDFAAIFAELSEAIECHGRALEISHQVRAVIDRYDMLDITRSDGAYLEVDFGLRHGDERIVAHFFMSPAKSLRPAHVAYDVDWHCGETAPGLSGVEKRSWNWNIATPAAPCADEPQFQFTVLQ